MPIIKSTVTPSRVPVEYHKLQKVETAENFVNAVIYVKSYVDKLAEEQQYLAWMWQLNVPLQSITSLNPIAIETLLIESPDSPFYGGQQVLPESFVENAQ
jgi:hypothetical protein